MPSYIAGTQVNQSTVFPGKFRAIEVCNFKTGEEELIVVGCDKTDRLADVYMFEQPEDLDIANEAEVLEHCIEANFEASILHKGDHSIDAYSRAGDLAKVIIHHFFDMAPN